ncbi:tripartite tricarboxylate transporter substrate binding protein [Ammoniphilus sp. YIM 78166]|uniref:tripartite tricarboxylate transporter substrate binding protein n=1 Tax=Ammoniphilus sp. YIM 78166 TaxID=1644106 RepID=UPI00106FC5B1|nr:tripartite tricarboxylate transporter substrate binding protein [Ammoniphilus sp. YIM 78166]
MKKFTSCLAVVAMSTLMLMGCGTASNEKASTPQQPTNAEPQAKKVDFPKGDITFLIPNGPGGANDLSVRGLIPGLEKELKVKVIPENKPASGGAVAAVELATGQADGQKLYFNSQTLILMPYSGKKEIEMKNYQPVAQVVEDSSAITVNANAPFNTLQELVDYAKQNPGKLKMAMNGKGALWHLSAATFAKNAGIEFQYVPYLEGGAQMSTALAAGEVDVSANSPSEVKPLVDSGKLKILAIQSQERHLLFPDIPTAKEAGIDSAFPVWRGIFTKSGVEAEKLTILDNAVKAAMESIEFQEFLKAQGMPAKYRDHSEFTQFVEKEAETYAILMKELGVE